jgi:hypothetical protein
VRRESQHGQLSDGPFGVQHLDDAEVQHVDHRAIHRSRNEQVARLHVPVNEAQLVPRAESTRRLRQHFERGRQRRNAHGLHPSGQVVALQKLHHEHVQVVLRIGAEVVDAHHVGVVEPGRLHRLALEARASP